MAHYLDKFVASAKRVAPAPLKSAVRRAVIDGHQPPDPFSIAEAGLARHQVRVGDRVVSLFFVMGCFKSGTHWLQNLLNLHPKVNVQGEFHFEVVLRAIEHARTTHWFRGSTEEFTEPWMQGGEALIRRIMGHAAQAHPEATHVGDRSPGPLCTVIRGAPHIAITRDCRDVLVSWSFHHLLVDNEHGMDVRFRELWRRSRARFLEDPEGFEPRDGLLGDDDYVRAHASQWASIVRTTRENAPRMREAGTPALEIRYEELHADCATQRRRLFEHLGLDPACAAEPDVSTRTTPGFDREDRTSFYRRGRIGDWQRYFDDRLARIVKEAAGEELVAEGYEKDSNW